MVGDAHLEPAALTKKDIVGELHTALKRVGELVRALELHQAELAGGISSDPGAKIAELTDRLSALEADQQELAARLVETEHQRGRLMNLYVATFQLHSTLDPEEVQATIAEIAVDLLGAEKFVLLLRTDDGHECEVALARGLDEEPSGLFGGGRYRGGDPILDSTLADGVLRLTADGESGAVAAVPLRVQDAIVGAVVLLKLFDHKSMLVDEDRDLLELLAAHAASALFAARVHSTADRKLRTLESLVRLVRGA